MKTTFKKLWVLWYKYTPIIFLIAIPLMILYGSLSSWNIADKELKNHTYEYKILVGFTSQSVYSEKNPYSEKSRTYMLIGKGLSNIKRITISNHSVNGLSVEVENGGLIQLILIYMFLILWGWYVWLRKSNANIGQT